MYLEEIIGKQVFEDLTHEFKARLDRTDIVGWLKTIAGFANNIGGELFIGVEDKTSKLIGFDRKGADNERNFFNNMVNQLPTGQSPGVWRIAGPLLISRSASCTALRRNIQAPRDVVLIPRSAVRG